MGQSIIVAPGGATETAKFMLGEQRPGDRPTTGATSSPGSGETGPRGRQGRTPVGYYKDPEKSAATFLVIDGDALLDARRLRRRSRPTAR